MKHDFIEMTMARDSWIMYRCRFCGSDFSGTSDECPMRHATKIPWITKVQGPRYGTDHTYQMAAEWLWPACRTVADWGGCQGYAERYLPPPIRYWVVDGTASRQPWPKDWVVANLADYAVPSEGILLRHVLEMTEDWAAVLENAVKAFTKRMVVVTFTPQARKTWLAKHHLTWPVFHFNHKKDLIPRMEPYLKDMKYIQTTQPERVYYLEKS
jgi:hypothetical protein